MARGSGFIEVHVKETRAESGKRKTRGGGKRARGHDGKAHVGVGEKRFSKSAKITTPAGQAHDFVNAGPSFPKLFEEPAEPEGGQLSFEGVGGEDEITLEEPNCAQNAAETGEVG